MSCPEHVSAEQNRTRKHPLVRLHETEQERLPGGGPKVGTFWMHCKGGRRCRRPPYDRLLANPVLRADYRCHRSDTGGQWTSGRMLSVPRRRFRAMVNKSRVP